MRCNVVMIACGVSVYIISNLYSWLSTGRLDVDDFFRPLPLVYVLLKIKLLDTSSAISVINFEKIILYNNRFRFYWNQRTPFGYFAEFGAIVLFGFAYLAVMGTFLVLFISMSLHHQAFYKMFQHKVDEMNRSNEKHCAELFLRHLIRFHTEAKG